jgi:uncharacterized protein YdaU (DUF1376 family)
LGVTVAASPAFQFYVNDFLGSVKVQMMMGAELGVYFMLLLLDWQETGFEYDPPILARWCRVEEPTFNHAWVLVQRCFEERGGRMFNPRLELERQKQRDWAEKSRKGGLSNAKRWLKGATPVVEANDKGGSTTVSKCLSTPSPSPSPVTTKAKDLSPKATDEKHSQPSTEEKPNGKPTWLTPFGEVWERRVQADPNFGELALVMGKLKKKGHKESDIYGAWVCYVDATDPQFLSISRFGTTYGVWAGTAKTKADELAFPEEDAALARMEAAQQETQ